MRRRHPRLAAATALRHPCSALPVACHFTDSTVLTDCPACCSWDDWKKTQDEAAAREAAMEAAVADAEGERRVRWQHTHHPVCS